MTYVPHYRVTISGDINNSASTPMEIFSYGFQIGLPGTGHPDPGPMPTGAFENLEGIVAAYHSAPGTAIAGPTIARRLKVAQIKTDGHYAAGPQEVVLASTGGSGGGLLHPLQVAYAVSLTGPPALRPRRGRWYVPTPAMSIDGATGGMTPGVQAAALATAVTLIDGINAILDDDLPGFRVVIAGQENAPTAPVRPPENAVVDTVRVGRIFDTQRRRRNDLVESYLQAVISP